VEPAVLRRRGGHQELRLLILEQLEDSDRNGCPEAHTPMERVGSGILLYYFPPTYVAPRREVY
jgi:hypothetical protein